LFVLEIGGCALEVLVEHLDLVLVL
jgi:hypothetical protein